MGANDIVQSLVESIRLISDDSANNINAPVTIKGEIVEEIDKSTHEYSVKYGGNIYKGVYANSNVSYSPSTVVWILIPNGNFDNSATILGAVTPVATEYVTEEQIDKYISLSENLFGENNYYIDLKSWVNGTFIDFLPDKPIPVDEGDLGRFNLILSEYFSKNKNFTFTANIKTEIDEDHRTKGNYGLILNLPFITVDENGNTLNHIMKSFVMDVDTIEGSPYSFLEYNKVNLYYEIDDTLVYDVAGTPSLVAFVEDFEYYNTEGYTDADIHIKDIGINMVKVLTDDDINGYNLTIVPSDGHYFLEGKYVQDKILTPVLKINGKQSDIKKWDCYWFVKDSSIDTSSEGYVSTIGGLGWRCLNKKTSTDTSFQYVVNSYKYTVKPEDVVHILEYKCVLVKDTNIVSGIIELKNLNTSYEIELVTETGKLVFPEKIGKVTLIARLYSKIPNNIFFTYWQRFDKDGNYLDSDFYDLEENSMTIAERGGENYYCNETKISYSCSKLEKMNTINCTFYSQYIDEEEIKKNNIGTTSIVVRTSKELTYSIAITGGDVIYKYDPEGDSPFVADYDGPISSRMNVIQPISYKVFKPEGNELTDLEYLECYYTWYFPKNSMMKIILPESYDDNDDNDDYYIIKGKGVNNLNYTILDTYNKKKSNNTILLEIQFDGNKITSSVTPKFLKDGESGTNGSKYTVVLTYKEPEDDRDYGYGELDGEGKIRKLQFIYLANKNETEENPGEWKRYSVRENKIVDFETPQLNVNLYRDGAKLNLDSPSISTSISWSMFDNLTTDPCFSVSNGIINKHINWTDASKNYCNIVVCSVTINSDNEEEIPQVIYAYYPIEITRLIKPEDFDLRNNYIVPSLTGGFDEVLYAFDGTNPQYDNTNPFVFTNELYQNEEEILYYAWKTSENSKVIYYYTSKDIDTIQIGDIVYEDKFGQESEYLVESIDRENNQIIIHSLVCERFSEEDVFKYGYVWGGSKNLSFSKTDYPYIQGVKPITKYINGLTKNFVKVLLTLNDAQITDIKERKANLASQIEDINKLMISYNKIFRQEGDEENLEYKGYLVDFLEKFSYNNSKEKLDIAAVNVLYNREKVLLSLSDLFIALENFINYCKGLNYKDEIAQVFKFMNTTTLYNIDEISTICDNMLIEVYQDFYLFGNKRNSDERYDFNYIKENCQLFNCRVEIANESLIDEDSFKIKEAENLINIWNEVIVKKYYPYYKDLITEDSAIEGDFIYQEQYNNLCSLLDDILNLYINMETLTNNEKVLDEDLLQEFTTIKDQLKLINNNLTQIDLLKNFINNIQNSKYIIEKTDYENCLNKIQELLNVNQYYNYEYDKKRFDEKILKAQSNLEEVQAEYDEVSKNLLPDATDVIIHIKPIVMIYNIYGFSAINGWDGCKLYTGGENEEYLYAPQIGAGKKENGQFTGLVMGMENLNTNVYEKIGLFGLSEGVQSLFLNAKDGSAIFGKSGTGQIIIDPNNNGNKALLYSSNYWTDYERDGKPKGYGTMNEAGQGMLIDLTTPEIKFGNGNFKVNSDGHITAVGGGTIGGWKITDTQIHSNISPSNGRITLDSGVRCYSIYKSYLYKKTSNIWTIYNYCTLHCVIDSDALKTARIKEIHYINDEKIEEVFKNYECVYNEEQQIYNLILKEGDEIKYTFNIKDNLTSAEDIYNYMKIGICVEKDFEEYQSGKIYSHSHDDLNDMKQGFYLSQNGLSIGNTIRITAESGVTDEGESAPGDGGLVEIGRLSGTKKWEINGDMDNSYIKYGTQGANNSIYIGTEKITLGKQVYITDNGIARFGRDAVTDGNKCWTIDATENSHSYIGYNASEFDCDNLDKENYEIGGVPSSVYLGTNGIRLGKKFAVDYNGNLVAENIIANDSGYIAGWKITSTSLKSDSNSMEIKAEGSLYGPNEMWHIDKNGNAVFNNIEANSSGRIGGWYIKGNQLQYQDGNTSTMILNGTDGSITSTNSGSTITFSPSGINLSGVAAGLGFSLGYNGLSFQNGAINLTAGTSGIATFTENNTKVQYSKGTKGLGTYVGDIVADTIKTTNLVVDKIADVNILNVKGLRVKSANNFFVGSGSGGDNYQLTLGNDNLVHWHAI